MVRSWEHIPSNDLPKGVRSNITHIENEYHGMVDLVEKTFVLYTRQFTYKVVLTGHNPYQVDVFRQERKRHSAF